MENRKYIVFLVLLLTILIYQPARAYETDTHELLSQETVRFYNQHYSTTLNGATLAPFLIDGARREDDAPRWMNHFYDPVKNRGLSQDSAIDPWYQLGTWNSSKVWAQNSESQNKLVYSPIIASVLSLIETGKIQKFIPTSDFTWKQAQKYWIQGDTEMAMFTLGHIIHLIQDASVPDHTRNDPHGGDGSPYETYTGRYTVKNPDISLETRLASISKISKNTLDEYFNELALYSNNNFYSKDTIGIQSGYDKPQSEEMKLINDEYFILGKDGEGNVYKLLREINFDRFGYAI